MVGFLKRQDGVTSPPISQTIQRGGDPARPYRLAAKRSDVPFPTGMRTDVLEKLITRRPAKSGFFNLVDPLESNHLHLGIRNPPVKLGPIT